MIESTKCSLYILENLKWIGFIYLFYFAKHFVNRPRHSDCSSRSIFLDLDDIHFISSFRVVHAGGEPITQTSGGRHIFRGLLKKKVEKLV